MNLASPYLWIGKNLLCKEKGYIGVDEEYHCKAAAEEKGSDFKSEDESSHPKGCYFDGDGNVWFNYNSNGTKHTNLSSICKSKFNRSQITALRYDNNISSIYYQNALTIYFL